MRLIVADELQPDTEWSDYYDGYISYSQSQIDNCPEIILRNGEWIRDEKDTVKYWCSRCREYFYGVSKFRFCPSCGAIMGADWKNYITWC